VCVPPLDPPPPPPRAAAPNPTLRLFARAMPATTVCQNDLAHLDFDVTVTNTSFHDGSLDTADLKQDAHELHDDCLAAAVAVSQLDLRASPAAENVRTDLSTARTAPRCGWSASTICPAPRCASSTVA
jgi:hypothetical protein